MGWDNTSAGPVLVTTGSLGDPVDAPPPEDPPAAAAAAVVCSPTPASAKTWYGYLICTWLSASQPIFELAMLEDYQQWQHLCTTDLW
jgi:hypothetical protein